MGITSPKLRLVVPHKRNLDSPRSNRKNASDIPDASTTIMRTAGHQARRADDLRNASQFPCQPILVEASIEPLRNFLQLQLHRHPVQQQKVLVAQLAHLSVQERTQLVRKNE